MKVPALASVLLIFLVSGTGYGLGSDFSVDSDPLSLFNGVTSNLAGDPVLSDITNLGTTTPPKTTFELSTKGETTPGTLNLINSYAGDLAVPLAFGGVKIAGGADLDIPSRQHSQANDWNLSSGLLIRPARDQNLSVTGAFQSSWAQLPGSLSEADAVANPDLSYPTYANDVSSTLTGSGGLQWDFGTSLFHLSVPVAGNYQRTDSYTPSQPTAETTLTTDYFSGLAPRAVLILPHVAGGSLTVGTGIDTNYRRIDFNQSSDLTIQPPQATLATVDRAGAGGWVLANQNWKDTFIVEGGVRADWSRTTGSPVSTTVPGFQVDYTPLVYAADLTWIPKDKIQVTLGFSTMDQVPDMSSMLNTVPQSGVSNQVNYSLQPVTGYKVAVGAKVPVGTVGLGLTSSLVRQDNTLISVVDSSSGNTEYANGGPSFDGTADLGLSIPFDRLAFQLGSMLVTVDYTYELAWFVSGSAEGKQLDGISNHRLGGSIQWNPTRELTIETDGQYKSDYFETQDTMNTGPLVGSKIVYNLSANYILAGTYNWTIGVYMNNITDNRVPDSISSSNYNPAQGRTIGLNFKVSY